MQMLISIWAAPWLLKGDKKLSMTNLQRCVDLDKRNAEAYQLLASISASDGKFPQALKFAQTACNLEPGNQDYKTTLQKIKAASDKAK